LRLSTWSAADGEQDNICLKLWIRLTPLATRSQEPHTVSCFPSFTASVVTITLPSFFGREKLRASLELETLLYQRFLKLLIEYLLWPGYMSGARHGKLKVIRDFLVDVSTSSTIQERDDDSFGA